MPEVVETPVVEQPVITPATTPAAEVTPRADQNIEVSATPAEGADTPATVETPEKQTEKKSQSRFDRKISRLYREAAEQKARADLLEQRLNEAMPKTPDDGAPRMEQFDDIEKYAKAYAEHEKAKAFKEYESKQRTEAQKTAEQQLRSDWEAKLTKAEAKYEDFDEVVGELQPTTPWAVAIMRAENGEDIAHHLGLNMAEAKRITSLDPVAQFIEIGKLSAKLAAQPIQPKVSKAPEPINPVSGTRATIARSSLEASNYKDFLRARNKELGRST